MRAFLRRLIRHSPRKVFLMVDRHPVHRSSGVQRWLAQHADRIRLFFLPTYSPELNPDEYLNNDVKANAVGRQRRATPRTCCARSAPTCAAPNTDSTSCKATFYIPRSSMQHDVHYFMPWVVRQS